MPCSTNQFLINKTLISQVTKSGSYNSNTSIDNIGKIGNKVTKQSLRSSNQEDSEAAKALHLQRLSTFVAKITATDMDEV